MNTGKRTNAATVIGLGACACMMAACTTHTTLPPTDEARGPTAAMSASASASATAQAPAEDDAERAKVEQEVQELVRRLSKGKLDGKRSDSPPPKVQELERRAWTLKFAALKAQRAGNTGEDVKSASSFATMALVRLRTHKQDQNMWGIIETKLAEHEQRLGGTSSPGGARTDTARVEPRPEPTPVSAAPAAKLNPPVCGLSRIISGRLMGAPSVAWSGDLDGDGRTDKVMSYMTSGPGGRGVGGVAILRGTERRDCYNVVYQDASGRGSGLSSVLQSRTNGWSDVAIMFTGDADSGAIIALEVQMTFDGSGYRWSRTLMCESPAGTASSQECEEVYRSYGRQ